MYVCGGGRACLNAFTISETVDQDVDTNDDHDEDGEDYTNDDEDNV